MKSYFPITSQPAQLFVSEENSWTKTLISYPLSLLGSQNTKRKEHSKPSLFFLFIILQRKCCLALCTHYALQFGQNDFQYIDELSCTLPAAQSHYLLSLHGVCCLF